MNHNFHLKSTRLCVQIAPSGSFYSRSRFDWSGNIVQVTMDGTHTFCGDDSRSEQYSCAAAGLMNEFVPSDQGTFDTSDEANCFLKMGVGILRKIDNQPYSQKTRYPVVQHAQIQERCTENKYTAIVKQPVFLGFSYLLQKTCTVEKNRLKIHYALKNTGEKTLCFGEYTHNFYRLSACGRTKDCTLKLSFLPQAENGAKFTQQGKLLHIAPFCEEVISTAVTGMANTQPVSIAVENRHTGLRVTETVSHPLQRCFIWALQDVLCPEMVVSHTVELGTSVQWQRDYLFEKGEL